VIQPADPNARLQRLEILQSLSGAEELGCHDPLRIDQDPARLVLDRRKQWPDQVAIGVLGVDRERE